jgi:hypothetical protein
LPYKPTPSIDCNKYVHHTQYWLWHYCFTC